MHVVFILKDVKSDHETFWFRRSIFERLIFFTQMPLSRIEVPDKICKESDKILLKICTDSAQILAHFLSDLCQVFVRSDKNSVRILSDSLQKKDGEYAGKNHQAYRSERTAA